MAQTFTGKMFSMRNNSLKNGAAHGSSGAGSGQLAQKNNTINIQNFGQQQPGGNAARSGQNGQHSQGAQNMNKLLTQLFPNNNYTARH